MTLLIISLWVSCLLFAHVESIPSTATHQRIRTISQPSNAKDEERGVEEVVMETASASKRISPEYQKFVAFLSEPESYTSLQTLDKHVKSFNEQHPTHKITLLEAVRERYTVQELVQKLEYNRENRDEHEKRLVEQLRHEQLQSWLQTNTDVEEIFHILDMKVSQMNILKDPKIRWLIDYIELLNESTHGDQTLLAFLLVMVNEETVIENLSELIQLRFPLEYERKVTNVVKSQLLKSWRLQKLSANDIFLKLKLGYSIDVVMYQYGYRKLLEEYVRDYLLMPSKTILLALLIRHFGASHVAENLARWKLAKSDSDEFKLLENLYKNDFVPDIARMGCIYAEALLNEQLESWLNSEMSISLVIRLLSTNGNNSVFSKYKMEVILDYLHMSNQGNDDKTLLDAMISTFGNGKHFASILQKASHDSMVDTINLEKLRTGLFELWIRHHITPSSVRAIKFKFPSKKDITITNEIIKEFRKTYNIKVGAGKRNRSDKRYNKK